MNPLIVTKNSGFQSTNMLRGDHIEIVPLHVVL